MKARQGVAPSGAVRLRLLEALPDVDLLDVLALHRVGKLEARRRGEADVLSTAAHARAPHVVGGEGREALGDGGGDLLLEAASLALARLRTHALLRRGDFDGLFVHVPVAVPTDERRVAPLSADHSDAAPSLVC